MNRLLTLVAWIAAGIRRLQPKRLRGAQEEDLAQQQDHCLPAARAEDEVAQREELTDHEVAQREELSEDAEREEVTQSEGPTAVAQPEELSDPEVAQGEESSDVALREDLRVDEDHADDYRATPRRVDTASWEFFCETAEWSRWAEIKRAAKAARGSVEWVDENGIAVVLALDRGKPGSGTIVLSTGATRIEIKRSRAEVQISQLASEVEGVPRWGLRWLPRAAWWLTGHRIAATTCQELGEQLDALGIRQRRIETCVDIVGWQIRPGDERGMVSKAHKFCNWHVDDTTDGFGAGQRKSSPDSIGVYDKIGKLMSQRGPMREALLHRLTTAGWRPGDPVARIETRKWGEGLRLEGVDATHPGAAFDEEILDALFVDSLSRHRLIDTAASASRKRDKREHRAWEIARAAGGSIEPVKLQRERAKRQLSATKHHTLRRFGRLGADVEELLLGDGSGSRAREALDGLIRRPEWETDRARARARYAELLDQAEADDEDDDEEP